MTTKKEYKPLIIPQLKWDRKTLNETYGELIVQPLEPGFGITIGNSLRRILLGGVEGSAVTSVIIKGINNEFSAIPGIIEDSMQLVLNIKGIVVRNTAGIAGKMHLRKTGEGVVTVGDIVADEHLELVNKDHVLAHIAFDGDLDIEFFVESGRGYQVAQWPAGKPYHEDGRIYLDAMFSPISKVTFDVEKTRVGEAIDYDRLVLRVHTNGSENPIDALHYAVSVLRTQLEHFLESSEIPFNEISSRIEESVEKAPLKVHDSLLKGVPVELLFKSIDELELSVRAHNCLLTAGINRVIDLVNVTEDEALKIKNFGRKSLNEVKDSMKAFGISFGMNINEDNAKKMLNQE